MRCILIFICLAFASMASAADNNRAPAASSQTYTIFCTTFADRGHIEQAKSRRDAMIKKTGMKDWYVVSTSELSTLYYGYYTCIDERVDAKEAARAQKDRKTIADLQGSDGKPLFIPLLLSVEEADPSGKPEWDLRNAKGFWSLQIAAFVNDPHRKTSAVQAVAELRKEGVEAFYYNGPTTSSVCIGVFPESSAIVDNGPDIKPGDQVVFVQPNIPMPQKSFRTPDGREVIVKQVKINIVDPVIKSLMQKYPHHATDGVEGKTVTIKGKPVDEFDPSFLVKIPQNEGRLVSTPSIPAGIIPSAGGSKTPGSTGGTTPKNPPEKKPGGKLPGLDF